MMSDIKPEWEKKYSDSLTKHLLYYREAAHKIGVDPGLIAIHDESKMSDAEYPAYVRKFGGGIDDKDEFDAAINHHFHHNPHHWQHWMTPKGSNEPCTVVRMPDQYVVEMVADWMGSGRAYTGDWDMSDWLSKNLYDVTIHKDARGTLYNVLIDTLGYSKGFIQQCALTKKTRT